MDYLSDIHTVAHEGSQCLVRYQESSLWWSLRRPTSLRSSRLLTVSCWMGMGGQQFLLTAKEGGYNSYCKSYDNHMYFMQATF